MVSEVHSLLICFVIGMPMTGRDALNTSPLVASRTSVKEYSARGNSARGNSARDGNSGQGTNCTLSPMSRSKQFDKLEREEKQREFLRKQ